MEVVRWLDEEDFSGASIISKIVLDNIILIQELSLKENDKKYKNLINLLAFTDEPVIFNLLQDYLNVAEDSECDVLLEKLIPYRISTCCEILSADKLNRDRQDLVLAATIKYSKNYAGYENNEIISQYVGNHNNYLNVFGCVNDDLKVKKFLDTIRPKFKFLISGNGDNGIQKFIIENNLYELKLENLVTIFNADTTKQNCEFYTKNYETLLMSDKDSVKTYLENNIDDYVDKILLNAEVTCESESNENMLRLMTNEQVSVEHRKLLLTKIKVEFEDVKQFTPDLYDALFDNDRIMPTWQNIQIAYEIKGFDCVRDFIKRHKVISGKFFDAEGIKKETPMQLMNLILKDFNEEEAEDVSKSWHVIVPIGRLELPEIDDIVLSKFISSVETRYREDDLSLLVEKPKSFCAYIISHSKEITDNFDGFFSEELPQDCYASIISCLDIDENIKEKLIETDYNLIKIEGYEQIYADYILSGHAVPTEILWQFSNTSLDSDKKLKILEICDYGGEVEDASMIKQYLMSAIGAFKNIFGTKKEDTIEKTDRNKKLLDILFYRKIIIGYKKVRNRDEYSVKAA